MINNILTWRSWKNYDFKVKNKTKEYSNYEANSVPNNLSLQKFVFVLSTDLHLRVFQYQNHPKWTTTFLSNNTLLGFESQWIIGVEWWNWRYSNAEATSIIIFILWKISKMLVPESKQFSKLPLGMYSSINALELLFK